MRNTTELMTMTQSDQADVVIFNSNNATTEIAERKKEKELDQTTEVVKEGETCLKRHINHQTYTRTSNKTKTKTK